MLSRRETVGRHIWWHGFYSGGLATTVCFIIVALLTAFLGVALAGCSSPKKEIGQAATAAKSAALETKATVQAAIATGDIGPKALPLINAIAPQQDIIIRAADGIADALPGVEDKESLLHKILKWWPVLPVIAVIGVLAYLGLLPLAVRLCAFLFSLFPRLLAGLIPPRVHSEAKLDFESLNGGGHPLLEQAVAARRATRPAYAAAFLAVKKRAESLEQKAAAAIKGAA